MTTSGDNENRKAAVLRNGHGGVSRSRQPPLSCQFCVFRLPSSRISATGLDDVRLIPDGTLSRHAWTCQWCGWLQHLGIHCTPSLQRNKRSSVGQLAVQGKHAILVSQICKCPHGGSRYSTSRSEFEGPTQVSSPVHEPWVLGIFSASCILGCRPNLGSHTSIVSGTYPLYSYP